MDFLRRTPARFLGLGLFAATALLTALLGLASSQKSGEDPPPPLPPPPTAFECRWADGPMTIDGKADEKAWQHAQTIDKFYLPWLGKKARLAKTATKAKLLWDREYLYFHADMEDTDLYADVKQHDGQTWDNDVFELFFKPADDKPGYYEFQVSAAGTVMDMFIPRRNAGGYGRFKSDGDFHIDAKVVLDGTLNKWADKDKGWAVEGRIPWKDFMRTGGRPNPNERWKFALCRYDYSVDFEGPDLSTCAPLKSLNHANFHYFEDYATLTFVGSRKESAARPYGVDQRVALTTSRVVGSPDAPPAFTTERVYPNVKPNFPIFLVHQPGSDRYLMIHQAWSYGPSTVSRFKDDPAASEFETLYQPDGVAYSIVFHPKFAENGYVFVGHNGPQKDGSVKKTVITRYTIDRQPPYKFDLASAKIIFELKSDGHNGGAMAFGHDGMFYITTGDGTSDSDTNVVGQDMSTLLAKVLRIDIDHPEPGKTYSVPKDNPFVSMKGARPEIWALGLRNPWRMTVDAKTGHLWVGNNGQDLWEQAYLVKKGDNYGWSVTEGSHPFYPTRKAAPVPLTKPTVEHHHSESRSLTGGIVYHGKNHPELVGAYIYGDHSTGNVWAVKHDGEKVLWHKLIAATRMQITSFAVDPRGEILLSDHRGGDKGGFYTLIRNTEKANTTFPAKLSDSGLFQSVKGHIMQPALIPYSVAAPLWGDNAHKERWLALPGESPTIDFTTSRGWNFPDGTVLVKSFALDLEEGKPATRKWVETRFLTRQRGEWFGYSYAWNDEQTEGFLVEGAGRDRVVPIKVAKSAQHPDGVRQQTWHFPSRTECMVCHSRAANWVLGLTEVQMNKVHDYGNGVQDNQLRTLEHLGVLKVSYASEVQKAWRAELRKQGSSDSEVEAYIKQQTATRGQREAVGSSSLLTHAPEKYRKLVDPYDNSADIVLRAKSYLHSNCAHCHVEAGGGNALMELEFNTELKKARLIDVRPVHDTFGLKDARLVAPGHPERSVLLHRVGCRGKGQMPPLATSLIDEPAVQMLRAWIQQMPATKEKTR